MKLLTDSFGRPHGYLRISVTDRCNLRCGYCMPPDGVEWIERASILTYEEITRLAAIFARMGVTKIRITGGEPLVRRQLDRLVAELAALPGISQLAMTTNGVHLEQQVDALKRAGLTHLNVSLDTLRPQRFREITRRGDYLRVRAGIEAALDRGFVPLRLNVVVMGGVNDDEILDFVEFVQDRPISVRFIEFMPFHNNHWSVPKLVPYAAVKRIIAQRYPLVPLPGDGDPSAVAKEFRIAGFAGSVGFVTSMTEDFCASCNRVRLTAEGAVKPCLHDHTEVELRDVLRGGGSDEVLEQMIRQAVNRKQWGHAPMEELVRLENRTMIQIGG